MDIVWALMMGALVTVSMVGAYQRGRASRPPTVDYEPAYKTCVSQRDSLLESLTRTAANLERVTQELERTRTK